jgi:hypothetical protein
MRLRITSIPNLIVFLKRLKAVEKSVILELTPDSIFSKIHTPDKATMKYSSLDLDKVFETDFDWKSIKHDRVKIGLNDVTRLMEAFKHFRPEEEVNLDIDVATVDESSVSTELRLVSPSLTIRLRCSDLTMLSYVEDKILSMVHSKEDCLVSFKMYQSDFTTIASLCGMESDNQEILCFEIKEKTAHAIGNSFNYKLNIGSSEIILDDSEKETANIYKSQLGYMESESCDVYVHDNRLVLFSEQSATSIAIGLVEK